MPTSAVGKLSSSTGALHTSLIAANGLAVYTWGDNSYGETGDPSNLSPTAVYPVEAVWGTAQAFGTAAAFPSGGLIQVDVGLHFTVVLAANGEVFSWGFNGQGQLGNTTSGPPRRYAMNVMVNPTTKLTNVIKIACGQFHTVALQASGVAVTWGSGSQAQLASGATQDRFVALPVAWNSDGVSPNFPAGGVIDIAASATASHFIGADYHVYGAGKNLNFQLGLSSTSARVCPREPLWGSAFPPSGIRQVFSVDSEKTFVLTGNGTVYAYGKNQFCGLGFGLGAECNAGVAFFQPTALPIWNVVSVRGGGDFTMFLKNDGSVVAIGNNPLGQLADGTLVAKTSLVTTLSGKTVTTLSGGQSFGCALTGAIPSPVPSLHPTLSTSPSLTASTAPSVTSTPIGGSSTSGTGSITFNGDPTLLALAFVPYWAWIILAVGLTVIIVSIVLCICCCCGCCCAGCPQPKRKQEQIKRTYSSQMQDMSMGAPPYKTQFAPPVSVTPAPPPAYAPPQGTLASQPATQQPQQAPPSPAPKSPPQRPRQPIYQVPPGTVLTVIADFDPQYADEIELRRDDQVEILECFIDEWAHGICLNSGAEGLFPLTYVARGPGYVQGAPGY